MPENVSGNRGDGSGWFALGARDAFVFIVGFAIALLLSAPFV